MRALFDRKLYQNHLLFLAPSCKNAPANFPCILDPLRLKTSDNIALTIHAQHRYRSTAHLTCLAARYGKDIPGAKTHAQAVESNDCTIGKPEPFGKSRIIGHVRSFHSVVFLSCQVSERQQSVRAGAAAGPPPRRVRAATAG